MVDKVTEQMELTHLFPRKSTNFTLISLDYDLATMRNIARNTRFAVFSSLTKDCSGFRLPKVARQRQDGRPTQLQS